MTVLASANDPDGIQARLELYGGIGDRVRRARAASGLSQAQVADAVGISVRTWARIESGDHGPDVWVLWRFAQCVGVSLDSLFPEPSS